MFPVSPHFHWDKKLCRISTQRFPQQLWCWEKKKYTPSWLPALMQVISERGKGHSEFQPVHGIAFCLRRVRMLNWQACYTLLPFQPAANIRWWLKFGKFGSGRRKAALGSSQSGGKNKKKVTGGRQNRSQTGWNAAKPWNEQFLSPSLS